MKQLFQNASSVWRIRDARLMLTASALVTGALGLSLVTLLLRVHASGAGPYAATLLLLCISLPTILTMGIAGSLADRYDSRLILVSTLSVQAAALAGLAVWEALVPTYLLTLIAMLAGSLGMPVWTALLPHLAGEEHTAQLVSVQQGLRSVAMPAGAGLAGVVVQTMGEGTALLIAASLSVVAGLTPLFVRTRRVPVAAEPLTLLPVAALRSLRGQGVAFVLVLALVPFIIAVEAVNAVEVFLVRDVLGASPAQFGLAAVAGGIGAVLGALAAGALLDPARRVPVTLAALALTAATQVGQGVAPGFTVFLLLCLVAGVALGLANALIVVVILDETPERLRGRVVAVVSGVARSGSVVATVLGGSLAVVMGPRLAFVTTGTLGMLTAVLAAYAIRRSVARAAEPAVATA
ncbi:MFS transporter [Nostocoides sp. F2B08]|uniref:MFS transporter n=1 Tax=Nostocoides sp. F2B08 TaxID=2653936 RepID=UPI001262CED3|nr:MFS transporter [Tetrasphaera sp. F2B08]KAB7745169.1 MFS transporter [Tetrasphaera sp. F2B08]